MSEQTSKRLIQRVNKEKELEYALDQYGEYGVLNIDNFSEDPLTLAKHLKEEFKLNQIITKSVKSRDRVQLASTGTIPENIIIEENDLKFNIKFNLSYEGLAIDQEPLRKIIAENSGNKEVLNLYANTGPFSLYSLKAGANKVDSVEKRNAKWLNDNLSLNEKNLDLEKHSLWEEEVDDFIKIAQETRTQYDVIILDLSDYNLTNPDFNIYTEHSDLIRKLQQRLLKRPGYLFFVTNIPDFVLDKYIRPGADKLTKQSIPENYLPLRPHQSFVFYN